MPGNQGFWSWISGSSKQGQLSSSDLIPPPVHESAMDDATLRGNGAPVARPSQLHIARTLQSMDYDSGISQQKNDRHYREFFGRQYILQPYDSTSRGGAFLNGVVQLKARMTTCGLVAEQSYAARYNLASESYVQSLGRATIEIGSDDTARNMAQLKAENGRSLLGLLLPSNLPTDLPTNFLTNSDDKTINKGNSEINRENRRLNRVNAKVNRANGLLEEKLRAAIRKRLSDFKKNNINPRDSAVYDNLLKMVLDQIQDVNVQWRVYLSNAALAAALVLEEEVSLWEAYGRHPHYEPIKDAVVIQIPDSASGRAKPQDMPAVLPVFRPGKSGHIEVALPTGENYYLAPSSAASQLYEQAALKRQSQDYDRGAAADMDDVLSGYNNIAGNGQQMSNMADDSTPGYAATANEYDAGAAEAAIDVDYDRGDGLDVAASTVTNDKSVSRTFVSPAGEEHVYAPAATDEDDVQQTSGIPVAQQSSYEYANPDFVATLTKQSTKQGPMPAVNPLFHSTLEKLAHDYAQPDSTGYLDVTAEVDSAVAGSDGGGKGSDQGSSHYEQPSPTASTGSRGKKVAPDDEESYTVIDDKVVPVATASFKEPPAPPSPRRQGFVVATAATAKSTAQRSSRLSHSTMTADDAYEAPIPPNPFKKKGEADSKLMPDAAYDQLVRSIRRAIKNGYSFENMMRQQGAAAEHVKLPVARQDDMADIVRQEMERLTKAGQSAPELRAIQIVARLASREVSCPGFNYLAGLQVTDQQYSLLFRALHETVSTYRAYFNNDNMAQVMEFTNEFIKLYLHELSVSLEKKVPFQFAIITRPAEAVSGKKLKDNFYLVIKRGKGQGACEKKCYQLHVDAETEKTSFVTATKKEGNKLEHKDFFSYPAEGSHTVEPKPSESFGDDPAYYVYRDEDGAKFHTVATSNVVPDEALILNLKNKQVAQELKIKLPEELLQTISSSAIQYAYHKQEQYDAMEKAKRFVIGHPKMAAGLALGAVGGVVAIAYLSGTKSLVGASASSQASTASDVNPPSMDAPAEIFSVQGVISPSFTVNVTAAPGTTAQILASLPAGGQLCGPSINNNGVVCVANPSNASAILDISSLSGAGLTYKNSENSVQLGPNNNVISFQAQALQGVRTSAIVQKAVVVNQLDQPVVSFMQGNSGAPVMQVPTLEDVPVSFYINVDSGNAVSSRVSLQFSALQSANLFPGSFGVQARFPNGTLFNVTVAPGASVDVSAINFSQPVNISLVPNINNGNQNGLVPVTVQATSCGDVACARSAVVSQQLGLNITPVPEDFTLIVPNPKMSSIDLPGTLWTRQSSSKAFGGTLTVSNIVPGETIGNDITYRGVPEGTKVDVSVPQNSLIYARSEGNGTYVTSSNALFFNGCSYRGNSTVLPVSQNGTVEACVNDYDVTVCKRVPVTYEVR